MFRKLLLASAVSLVLVPEMSAALGLGGIRGQSALNEPFVGEIDLLDVRPDELDTIQVALAPEAEFSKVGAERSQFLNNLRFKAQVSPDGLAVIRVSSKDPVREPFLDFLVEVTSPAGRLVKEYTVLLDPPVTTGRPPPPIEPAAVGAPASTVAAAASASGGRPAAVRSSSAAPPSGVDQSAFPLRYGPVKSGEGLWRIARRIAPAGATTPQTAMALYRNNQSAFIGGDINRLRQGVYLEIPTAAELYALDVAPAQREYSSALRGDRVTTEPITDIAAPADTADQLKIAAAVPPAAPVEPVAAPREEGGAAPELGAIEQELLLVQEAGESTRQETEELRGRIRSLETQLQDIRRLLQLRNAQLAELQSQGAEAEVDLTLAEAPSEEPSAPALEELAAATGEEDASAAVEEVAEAVAEPAEELAEPPAEPAEIAEPAEVAEAAEEPAAVPEEPDEAPVEIDEEATEPPEVAVTPPDTSGAKPEVAPPQTADTPPAPQPLAAEAPERPFWEAVPSSTLGLAVGVPLLVLASGLLLMRRRKRLRESLDWEFTREPSSREIADAEVVAASSLASTLGGTRESEQIERSATPYSGLSNLEDETEEADVLSEADVYIAYGRYREAESLLKEEIERSPERLDLKTKLAEAYYGSRNGDALQAVIEDMRRVGGDRISPDQWQRLAAMVNELQGTTVIDLSEAEPASPEPRHDEPATIASEVDESDVVSPSVPDQAPIRGRDERSGEALELDIEELAFDDRPPGRPEPSEPPVAAAPELELNLDDLDEFGGVDLEGLESGTRKSELVSGRIPLEPVESVLELPSTTQDAVTAEDILSSQWEMDSGPADEAATKIDLARAYVEMEDPDAARAILEEVIEEGNAAQRAEARAMLEQLS